MRKTVKVLHSVAAAGLVGGLFAYIVLLWVATPDTAASYADLRHGVAGISNWVLLPSLALALVSGLLSMIVHRPFQEKGWAWMKAGLGILMFKGVLTIVGAKADHAAALAERMARGEIPAVVLQNALAYEWATLWAVLAISVANYVLGIWRPSLSRRPAPAVVRTPAPAVAAPPPAAPPAAANDAPLTRRRAAPRPVAAARRR